MTFFIPFCCSIGKLCLLNFLFSLSLIPILILAKIQKREIYLKTSFQDFFHWKKNFLPFSFFIDLYCMYLCYTQPQIVFEMRKSYLNTIFHTFGKNYLHRFWFHLDKKNLSSFFQHFLHIMDTILSSVFMCVYALN